MTENAGPFTHAPGPESLSTPMHQEFALVKAEIRKEARKAARPAGMYGGAGFAGYMVLLFVSFAIWTGLATVMPSATAAIIVAVIWAIVGAVLYTFGRRQMREVYQKPASTTGTVRDRMSGLLGQRSAP